MFRFWVAGELLLFAVMEASARPAKAFLDDPKAQTRKEDANNIIAAD